MNEYSNISIYPLASSTQDKRYLLSCKGQYYEAGYPIVELLTELQEFPTEEEAVSSYIQKRDGKYTSEQVWIIIKNFITPLFSAEKKKRTFLYEKELFTASTVDKFSDTFSFLFNRTYIAVIFILTLVLDIHFFLTTDDLLIFNNNANLYMAGGLLIFMLLSSFFHELGHASACKYFGIQHGGIGFGLYLNFPVLYTDVSNVWILGRTERCVVNMAGIYFQCYWLIGILAAFLLTGDSILRYLILIMNLGFLMTLNPFFKFDGYWIASDLLGVPNLRARSLELINYCYKCIRKQQVIKVPYLLQIRSAEKYGLLVYSIVVNLFMGFYFFYIIPSFLYRFISTFPDAVNELVLYLANGMTPPFVLLRNIGTQLLFMTLIGYLFWNLIRPLIKRHVR